VGWVWAAQRHLNLKKASVNQWTEYDFVLILSDLEDQQALFLTALQKTCSLNSRHPPEAMEAECKT
jgi:hypothetical protein